MQALSTYLDRDFTVARIVLDSRRWHIDAGIPAQAGWYFIRTSAPPAVLAQQALWSETYLKSRTGEEVPVRNYRIDARAARYGEDLATCWNTREVYSGLAKNLRARAREHTFPDPGTAGLALSRYPGLRQYTWQFWYIGLAPHRPDPSCEDMVLKLGEQIWRSKHGWPLLCDE